MPLTRVLRLLLISFVAACTFGCGNSSDNNFDLNQSFQNTDAPVRLAFLNVPQRAAGTTFVPIRVGILDHTGQIVPTANHAVTISLANPGGATLSGTTTVNAVNGVAVFSDLSVDTPGDYNFTATADGLLSAQSQEFDITAGAPATITFLQGPPPADPMDAIVKGQPISPALRVEVRDPFGNLVTNDSTVTIAIANDPTGQARLGGTTQVPVSNGVATFDNLIVEEGGGVLVLAAVSGQGLAVSDPTFVAGDLFLYALTLGPNPAVVRGQVFPTQTMPSPVGALAGYQDAAGLSPLPNGTLVAVARNTGSNNFEVLTLSAGAPSTVLSNQVLSLPAGVGPSDITVDPATGTVYAYVVTGATNGLYTISPSTGTTTFVGATGLPGTGQGIAWEPFVAESFIFTGGGSTANGLSTLDPATGAGTEIPGTAANTTATLADLFVNPFDTQLYGLQPGVGLFTIDKTTGVQGTPQAGSNVFAAFTFLSEEPMVP